MVLDEDVADTSVGHDGETGPGVGKKLLGKFEALGFNESVEAGGECLERGFAADEHGDGGAEDVEGPVGEGSAAEEGNEAEEDGLVEAAGLEGHAVEEGVYGREAAVAGELEEEGGVGSVVVGEARLRGSGVEEVEGALWISLAVDEADGVGVGDKSGTTPAGLGKRRRKRNGGRRGRARSRGFEILERRNPLQGGGGGGCCLSCGFFGQMLRPHGFTILREVQLKLYRRK